MHKRHCGATSDLSEAAAISFQLALQHFKVNEEFVNGANNWLDTQAALFLDKGLQKLVPHYDKYQNLDGGYMDK